MKSNSYYPQKPTPLKWWYILIFVLLILNGITYYPTNLYAVFAHIIIGGIMAFFTIKAFVARRNQDEKAPSVSETQKATFPEQVPKTDTHSSIGNIELTKPKQKYEFITYRIAGVTFNNEDGSNRQNILRHIKFRDPPFDSETFNIIFDEYEYDGEPAIRVIIQGVTIGNLPKEDVGTFLTKKNAFNAVTDLTIVGGGLDDSGMRLSYGARIIVRYLQTQENESVNT